MFSKPCIKTFIELDKGLRSILYVTGFTFIGVELWARPGSPRRPGVTSSEVVAVVDGRR